jgi:hypothetical protein
MEVDEEELQVMIDKAVSRALDHYTPALVQRTADHVEKRFFENVGRHIVTRVLRWVGMITVAVVAYLYGHGFLR